MTHEPCATCFKLYVTGALAFFYLALVGRELWRALR